MLKKDLLTTALIVGLSSLLFSLFSMATVFEEINLENSRAIVFLATIFFWMLHGGLLLLMLHYSRANLSRLVPFLSGLGLMGYALFGNWSLVSFGFAYFFSMGGFILALSFLGPLLAPLDQVAEEEAIAQ